MNESNLSKCNIYIYYLLTSIIMNTQNEYSLLIDTLACQRKYGVDTYVKGRVQSLVA